MVNKIITIDKIQLNNSNSTPLGSKKWIIKLVIKKANLTYTLNFIKRFRVGLVRSTCTR